MRLILASTSRYRRELLARLRLPLECVAPDINEGPLQSAAAAEGRSPGELTLQLATLKAQSVAALHPDAVVLGSDQTCTCHGEYLHKPGTALQACAQLAFLAGKTHTLTTAVCICHQGEIRTHVDETQLTMRLLDSDAIERYVAADEPFDCAGSYKLESLGISLFERIDTADHTAITGLPLLAVARMLREIGLAIP